MVKNSLFPFGERTLTFLLQQNIIITLTVFWGDHTQEVIAPFSLWVWNQMPWRNLQAIVFPRDFLHQLLCWVDGLWESAMLWIVFLKTILIFSKNFLNFRFDAIVKQNIWKLCQFRSKNYCSVILGDFGDHFFLGKGEDAVFYSAKVPFIFLGFFV